MLDVYSYLQAIYIHNLINGYDTVKQEMFTVIHFWYKHSKQHNIIKYQYELMHKIVKRVHSNVFVYSAIIYMIER